jgi:hypothetical protein
LTAGNEPFRQGHCITGKNTSTSNQSQELRNAWL